jgi:histidyl-tRNA synthetase
MRKRFFILMAVSLFLSGLCLAVMWNKVFRNKPKHVLVIGENELKTGKGNIKEMANGEQTEVTLTANDIAETIGGEQHE